MPATDAVEPYWPLWKKFLFQTLLLFTGLFAISFSFPHFILPDIGAYTHRFFETLSTWFGRNVLGIKRPYSTELISDSTGFYINALFLFIVSIMVAGIWLVADKKTRLYTSLVYFFTVAIRYYLAVQLLLYGFSKVFKAQFYLPEPNTLYTPVGHLSADILYWSVMGVSRTYCMITGSLEVVAALLLLFRRTLLAGALVSFIALLTIFIINISFDISVKGYTLFLLLLCLILLVPYTLSTYHFLLQKPFRFAGRINFPFGRFSRYWSVGKSIVILVILIDALGPYVRANNYNDDVAPRPFLHGAYDISTFVKNGDTLPPLLTDTSRWRRVYIHRQHYFIVQYMNDAMQDYELTYDTSAKKIGISVATDSVEQSFTYRVVASSDLELSGTLNGDAYFMKLHKLDMQKLPAVRPAFHWTIDN